MIRIRADSKSVARKGVRVQVPPRVLAGLPARQATCGRASCDDGVGRRLPSLASSADRRHRGRPTPVVDFLTQPFPEPCAKPSDDASLRHPRGGPRGVSGNQLRPVSRPGRTEMLYVRAGRDTSTRLQAGASISSVGELAGRAASNGGAVAARTAEPFRRMAVPSDKEVEEARVRGSIAIR